MKPQDIKLATIKKWYEQYLKQVAFQGQLLQNSTPAAIAHSHCANIRIRSDSEYVPR